MHTKTLGIVAAVTLASVSALAGGYTVDGNLVDGFQPAIALGESVSGNLASGDLLFYDDGAGNGYYEDLYAISFAEQTAVELTLTTGNGGAWLDLFKWDDASASYLYVASASGDVDPSTATLTGLLNPGAYLVGVSSLDYNETFHYTLTASLYTGGDAQLLEPYAPVESCTLQADGTELCVYTDPTILYDTGLIYTALSADGGGTVLGTSRDQARALVAYLKDLVKRKNHGTIAGSVKAAPRPAPHTGK